MKITQRFVNSPTRCRFGSKVFIALLAISLFSSMIYYFKPNAMDVSGRFTDFRDKIFNLTISEEEEVKKVVIDETAKIQERLDENYNHLKNLENQIKLLTESGSEKELLSEKRSQAILNQSLNEERILKDLVDRLEHLQTKVSDLTDDGKKMLEDILYAKYQPVYDGKSIFLIDTRLDKTTIEERETDRVLFLKPRQACSVEAAALVNPDHDVFLLFARETGFFNTTPLPLVDAILSYKNVRLNRLNIHTFAKNTPLEEFMNSDILLKSSHILTHVSDVLRVLTLWKYTGAYYDSDVINLKPVSSNGPNFACFEKEGQIDSGLMHLGAGIGKEIAEECLNTVAKIFNPRAWTGNGCRIFTNVLINRCNTTDRFLMSREKCKGFSVLPPKQCYEIDFTESRKFFNENDVDEVMNRTQDSYAVHFWNVMTGGIKLTKSSKSAYIKLAEKFCPRVLAAVTDDF